MKTYVFVITAMMSACSAANAELYLGVDYSAAKFAKVGESNQAIIRKLSTEGVTAERTDDNADAAVTPFVGYRFNQLFGVEFGTRRFKWTSRVNASSGPTNLISSGTGALTPVRSVSFFSDAQTEMNAQTLGVTFTPSVSANGEIFSKVALIRGEVCSGVFERSDVVLSNGSPVRVEGQAKTCQSLKTHSFTLGYTHRLGRVSVTGYAERIAEVGSNGVVFVDGGGIGNQPLTVFGLRTAYHF